MLLSNLDIVEEDEHVDSNQQEVVSSAVSSPMPTNYSALGVDGMSISLDSHSAAHRPVDQWNHVEGTEAGMGAIAEVSSIEDEESSTTISDPANEEKDGVNDDDEDDEDDIWAATFKRVKTYQS